MPSPRGSALAHTVRPVTLLPPATGVLAGAAAALGAQAGVGAWTPVLAGALAAALLNAASNAANALADRDADAINKPERSLAPRGVAAIVLATLVPGLAAAWLAGGQFLACALGGALASAAYSAPPLRLKRWGWTAGLSIATARGLLLFVAGWATVADVTASPAPWILGGVFFVFLVGAQATKDFADVAGDRADGIASWPVALGPTRAADPHRDDG